MRSIAVIGLSSFGFYLCKYLADTGVEVMAIDINEDRINEVKGFLKKAIVADALDKKVLQRLALNDFDVVVISVGEPIGTSVLITLHLQELGIREIYAKAISDDHAKILYRIGAATVIFPEKDIANRIANTLRQPNLLEYVSLGEGFSMIELAPPSVWLGKTLAGIDIRNQFDVQVIMIKEVIPQSTIMIPSGQHIIKDSDILVILGRNEDLAKVEKL